MIKTDKISEKNIPQIAKLEKLVQHNPWSEAQFISEFQKGGFIGFVAFNNDTPIGFIVANKTFDEVELLKIGVDFEYRKKGIATNLLEMLFKVSIELKIKKIILEVSSGNYPALSLYKTSGFKKIAERKDYYGPNNSANILIKNLD